MTALALDIGGTKLAAGVVADDGSVLGSRRCQTPEHGVWDTCAALLQAVADGDTVRSVGIASAGPVDIPDGRIGPLNIPDWRDGFAITDAVHSLFPQAQISLAIDGAATALAEYRYGAARGVPNMLGMVVSTGVGGGILLDGAVVEGRTGNAGHIGHIVVPGEHEECACGGHGCLETVASGPSAVRWAQGRGWTGSTGSDLAESAAAGHATAVAALARAGTALGQAIAGAAALLDLSLVVIGGGFARSGPALWEPLTETVARHARLSYLRDLKVVPASLGPSATLIGAGALHA